jgi:hypothetical protein
LATIPQSHSYTESYLKLPQPAAGFSGRYSKEASRQQRQLVEGIDQSIVWQKKQIEKHIRKLGIGRKSNTSHMERLNGTIRGQQARLARQPAVWSRKGQKACFGLKTGIGTVTS